MESAVPTAAGRALADYIIEGSKDGLVEDLERKRAEGAGPLDIINGPLMKGMDEVGRLFNNNELIIAEVLQSAEAMKAAVNHLQQFMGKAETSTRGKIVLATVKGDVHDIGKNLVDIILSNNGYLVINLGIRVPPETLIRAHQRPRAGRGRPVRTAREERANHGADGERLSRSRNQDSAARRRRGAIEELREQEDRACVRIADLLCQGRHDRAAHAE